MQNQKVKIKIEFDDKELSVYNRTFTFYLVASPSFQYGNGTSLIDTRYYEGILSSFQNLCLNWLFDTFNAHKAIVIK